MTDRRQSGWNKVYGWGLLCVSLMGLLVLSSTRPLKILPSASAKAEILQLEVAISQFQMAFGRYPPGFVVIKESPEDWAARDKRLIRRIWPSFDYTQEFDLNNDGDTDDVHTLSGAECLVFFLGGVTSPQDGILIGFSKEPTRPFSVLDENRWGPFYEFDYGRMVDVDDDGFSEVVSSHPGATTPIFYSGPLTKHGCDKRALNVFPPGDSRNLQSTYQKPGGLPWKLSTFQLICPGLDDQYGLGGVYYDADRSDSGFFESERTIECDNITNLSLTSPGPHNRVSMQDVITTLLACAVVIAFAAFGARLLIVSLRCID